MLYDNRWNQRVLTTRNPFSVKSLIAWLETQPGAGYYGFEDNEHCLLAQYFRAKGYRVIAVGAGSFRYLDENNTERRRPYLRALDLVAVKRPWTFGAALARARLDSASACSN